MGCSWSKAEHSGGDGVSTPNALQAGLPVQRLEWRRRQEEKHQRQIQKLQKRHARRKQRRKRGSGSGTGSIQRRRLGGGGGGKSQPDLALQLRLLGGSNGSSATECVSALYARTLEQQREEFQRTVERRMLDQLDRELHTFLLNQLLLGVQFFSHFEAEMGVVDAELLARRQSAEHSLLQSGAIDAAVARNLLFKAGSSKTPPQPLQKPVTYVVFENVDVAGPHDANYDTVSALCKVLLETDYYRTTPCSSELVQLMEQTRWIGYVRLKLRDQSLLSSSAASVSSSSDEECVYADAGYPLSSLSSGYSSGDYDHVYLARLNTPRPLEELRLHRKYGLQSNVLPESCIRRLASCLPAELEQSEDEDDSSSYSSAASEGEQEDEGDKQGSKYPPAGYETVQVLRQCQAEQLQQCYLGSQQFMLYFGELLRQQLGQQLGISASQLSASSYRGCSVYTSREELVPAIHVPHSWPNCAFEFSLRARPNLTNLHTAEQFQWPTEQMRKRIRSFGYHVVPVGYAPKRSRNPFRELEWRIVFPQAEQFLERHCLTPMQLKVFQLMKLLVKTFVESTDAQPPGGVLLEQLRAHLFWQCERHSNDWPEEFLGERLVRFIRSFDACLAKKHLSDYFIERRNLFEHVPEDTLMKLRSVMAGIAEQPLLHVVQALRNLQHKPEFYPQLDYKRLLRNLCSQDYLELHGWGKFSRPRQGFPVQEEQEQKEEASKPVSRASSRRKTDITDAGGLLGLAQHQERSRGKLRRKTQLLKATNQLQLQQLSESQQRRSSLDSLDLHLHLARSNSEVSSPEAPAKPQLNNGLEILRRSNLLELLLDHLLAMLARAIRFGNRSHAQLYLEHGQRLCRLYQHLGCSQQAQHFVEELQQAASRMEEKGSSSWTPLPKRSSFGEDSPVEDLVESPPCVRRKSIKFLDQVVQIHSPDALARHKNLCPSNLKPSGILRSNSPHNDEGNLDAIESQGEVEEVISLKAEKVEDQALAENSAASKGEGSLLSLNGIVQRLNIDPNMIQTISSRTEQLVQKVAPSEAKREELKEILKSKTQKLKEAFN